MKEGEQGRAVEEEVVVVVGGVNGEIGLAEGGFALLVKSVASESPPRRSVDVVKLVGWIG